MKKISARRFRRAMVVAAADYYFILGVPESASSKEINAAYTKLVMQYFADVNEELITTREFKEISAAYEEPIPVDLLKEFFYRIGCFSGMGGTGAGASRHSTVPRGENLL